MSTRPQPGCLDESQLLDLADGVAPEALRSRAEAHLDGCATCRELLAGFLQPGAPAAAVQGEPAAATTQAATTFVEDTQSPSRPPLHALARGTLLGRYMVLERI
ncbi:zf-HC2 domain-containing protein, partial [Pyxidicoccus sp. 3LG]